ncbi:flagellar basal body rod protein [Bacillus sp. BRMEA1]|uniref:lmo0954 family membrane protein n=1 Tax=Neobacillus endophyticus TaxID=2738405 RepID=UPI0015648A08|nr:flagellar basal body rod protein [Neobacillus endophyticus]NRD80088.1 flagellar basal body rod protein [Neobacillus endophyticus]
MKKFGLILAGGLAALILLKSVGPIVSLLVSLILLYFIIRQFLKTDSLGWKIGLVMIGLIVLSSVLHHIPALIGAGAAYVLYLVYKEWNKSKKAKKETDPFTNFENQWEKLKKH